MSKRKPYTWRCPGGVLHLGGRTPAHWRTEGDTFTGLRAGQWYGYRDSQRDRIPLSSGYQLVCLPATPLACRLLGENP